MRESASNANLNKLFMPNNEEIGFLKYQGKLVSDGIIEAKVAARALNGFDGALRFFINQEEPKLADIELPIPVQMRKGSWEIHIPSSVEQWILSGAGIAVTAYFTKAASKLAEKDFKDVGLKDVFKKALKGIQWLVRSGNILAI